MNITLPELSLVALIGPSGAGKSSFARKHFKSTEVLSSDFCRGLVADNKNDQTATNDAFDVLYYIASKRLAAGRLTVIDATNVQFEARKSIVELARKYHCLPVAIVFNLPEAICQERNRERPDRNFGKHVIHQHLDQLRRSLPRLKKEGFRHVFVLSSPEDVEAVTLQRQPLWNNLRHEHGPFDIIGDVHGCFDELASLLTTLGYEITANESEKGSEYTVLHPEGRKAVFLGDLVDRGPRIPDVLRLVMSMVNSGVAFCVPGNHDMKLFRKLKRSNVQITHGLENSVVQLEKEPEEFSQDVAEFLDGLVSHYVLDDGNIVVAHAGMKAEMQGRGSGKVRDFALFGETTGETDEFGLPVRYDWASDYRGKAMVVYGHTPVPEPKWVNRTINIDTGCVFGGKLTALRYPEIELVSVQANDVYYEPVKPFLPDEDKIVINNTRVSLDILNIEDVIGKRIVSTRLYHNVTIREENAIAALDVMSRFAADPHWLIYLPPTMSPSETSQKEGMLEHPAEAFAYYRNNGISSVICEQKHMGSRAVAIVCKDDATAQNRFGIRDGSVGICYTRTGRRFFEETALEEELLRQVQKALTTANTWDELETDWVCLDCELMPWSAKAQALIKKQYAAVGTAGKAALPKVMEILRKANSRGLDVTSLEERFGERNDMLNKYIRAYRHYCWPVSSIDDFKLAPFHILATEGKVHIDKNHLWHMNTIAAFCKKDELLMTTNHKIVHLNDTASCAEGIDWWEKLIDSGVEGMVVKPLDFISRSKKGIIQPAIKCRGKEYLRIIYGPEYTLPDNLQRLRQRSLSKKRSLALREFALGIEALERFVRKEPLYRVHECVFGVIALESEAVDPRL
jgi:protein phosphatase